MFCHFNSSRAIVLLQLGRRKAHARSLLDGSSCPSLFNGRSDQPLGFHVLNEFTHVGSSSFSFGQRKIGRQELESRATYLVLRRGSPCWHENIDLPGFHQFRSL